MQPDFLGIGEFVWWFGVVEDRFDPLNLGRCKVRCFGWHNSDRASIAIEDLPWAHPIVPFGSKSTQPPTEGTMVFGFFADGKEGKYPILMGTVPGIPEEIRGSTQGFFDPYDAGEKAASVNPVFPRKVRASELKNDGTGASVRSDYARRYPSILNEPTVSRLARPERIESATTGTSLGVRSASITGTTIDFQRKNRVVNIKSAREDKGRSTRSKRAQTVWNEPFPSFNAKYPFNDVTETESGHAFEMDDTPGFERVQLSHRTGSTLEFLPSGSVKQKTFNNKYDIVMGNQKTYINGARDETVQSDMFLKVNGKLVIQCDGIDFESAGDINMKGYNIKISADKDLHLFGQGRTKVYGAGKLDMRSEGVLATYGGAGALHSSGGLTSIAGIPNPISAAIRELIREKTGIELPEGEDDILGGVKVFGPNFYVSTLLTTLNSIVTNIVPPTSNDPAVPANATVASRYKAPVPVIKATRPSFAKEKTDGMGFLEQQRIKAES